MKRDSVISCVLVLLTLLAGIIVFAGFFFVAYRPDRPVAAIVPGSSPEPAFVVQIIRPRLGLPLGGALPPQLFGLDSDLGFDSRSAGASLGRVEPGRLELVAEDWHVALVLDADGQVSPETRVVFELIFEERLRRVRCRPGDPVDGMLLTTAAGEVGEISGRFEIDLDRCEHADTGQPLGWPAEPLVLHGSFDRIPWQVETKPR